MAANLIGRRTGDLSGRSCESRERMSSRMEGESNGVDILKFVDSDANKMRDLKNDLSFSKS